MRARTPTEEAMLEQYRQLVEMDDKLNTREVPADQRPRCPHCGNPIPVGWSDMWSRLNGRIP